MTTLYSSVIQLHNLRAGELRRNSGLYANAVFYSLINAVDPTLAEALHQWNGRKPFTISRLLGLPKGPGKSVYLKAGWECWLRITTLGNNIFQPLMQHFLQGGGHPKIQLGALSFGVSQVLTTPASHTWAGYIGVETLLHQTESTRTATLKFASPTQFNLGDRMALFPLPALVFGSLASKWNAFLQPRLDREAVEKSAQSVLITNYRLRTSTYRWKRRVKKGFSGRCTYNLKHLSPDDQKLFCTLTDFAFYGGMGGKTTQGMGQVRRVPDSPTR
ncbi:MAG: CRISPR-associated endoribonuclease Cas6 [Chloroflexota bacterium]|nr:CRISPR-associated endoribonuclease Cas6 [Chloroflexota bacterium]